MKGSSRLLHSTLLAMAPPQRFFKEASALFQQSSLLRCAETRAEFGRDVFVDLNRCLAEKGLPVLVFFLGVPGYLQVATVRVTKCGISALDVRRKDAKTEREKEQKGKEREE